MPARWVVADSFSGRSGAFRRWLEEHGRAYAVMIPRTNAIQYQGGRIRVEQLAERLPRPDASGWQRLALSEECAGGMGRWLLIRHDSDDPSKDAPWLAYEPEGTSEAALIHVCNSRWQVERVPPGQIRTGEGGDRHGSLRGAHLGGMAPIRDLVSASTRPGTLWVASSWYVRSPGRKRPGKRER